MDDITKRIQKLEIYKKIIKTFYWLLSSIGITLTLRFPEHYICIFIMFLLSITLCLEININIDYQIENWERLKRKVE